MKTNPSLLRLLQSWALLALGILVSTHLVPGISYSSNSTFLVVVVLLGLFNAILKPLLVLFTLPFIVLTLGLGLLLINAFLLLLVGKLVGGFEVAGFGSAFLAGLIISIINVSINSLLHGKIEYRRVKGGRRGKNDDDVIDI